MRTQMCHWLCSWEKKKKLVILKPNILFLIHSWNWQINAYFTYGYNYPRTVVCALITTRCQADFQSISFTADTYLNTSITLSHTSRSINPRSLVSIQFVGQISTSFCNGHFVSVFIITLSSFSLSSSTRTIIKLLLSRQKLALALSV